jgi:hypothetical protein
MVKKSLFKFVFSGILALFILVFYISPGLLSFGNISKENTKSGSMKKIKITEDDIEYFVSTVIDFLNDQEDFVSTLDGLSEKQTEKLYQKIEIDLGNRLSLCDVSFKGSEQKDEWIVQKIHEIRKEVIENPKAYLNKE